MVIIHKTMVTIVLFTLRTETTNNDNMVKEVMREIGFLNSRSKQYQTAALALSSQFTRMIIKVVGSYLVVRGQSKINVWTQWP